MFNLKNNNNTIRDGYLLQQYIEYLHPGNFLTTSKTTVLSVKSQERMGKSLLHRSYQNFYWAFGTFRLKTHAINWQINPRKLSFPSVCLIQSWRTTWAGMEGLRPRSWNKERAWLGEFCFSYFLKENTITIILLPLSLFRDHLCVCIYSLSCIWFVNSYNDIRNSDFI